jgi:hypothetical protein
MCWEDATLRRELRLYCRDTVAQKVQHKSTEAFAVILDITGLIEHSVYSSNVSADCLVLHFSCNVRDLYLTNLGSPAKTLFPHPPKLGVTFELQLFI